MQLFIDFDMIISEALNDIPSTLRHATVAIAKKGFSASHAFNIARSSLQKHGFLKKSDHIASTQKGSRRNMKHSSERDNKSKNEKFKSIFKDIKL